MKSKILKYLAAVLLPAVMLAGCAKDEYTPRGDLFQPRFATNPAVTVKANDISIVWYDVNDAVGYTVQIFRDNYYTNLFMEYDTEDPFTVVKDLPYATRMYVRVRSNAKNPDNNSQWARCDFTTEARPDFAQLLHGINKAEIEDNAVTIHWDVDTENPVDSFSVVPTMNPELPTITGYIPQENIATGDLRVEGLNPSTLYAVNVYDTKKPRKYDKPYNEVTFRTTGPAAMTVEVGITDDLSAILTANNDDPDIPEGTHYELLEGTTYTITPFQIKKGFTIAGPADGTRPVIVINGTWNVFANAYLSTLAFENVEIRNAALNQYFFNSGNPFTIENVSFTNCLFRNINRGFWRHQNSNVKKIDAIEIDNCVFDQCGWQTGCYGTFAFGSAGKGEIGAYDQIGAMTIRNSTFMRGGSTQDPAFGWGNLLNHSTTSTAIDLTIENVTLYDFCVNNRLIDISNTERSSVTIRGMVVASNTGELIAVGSATTTNYSNNFVTSDYKLGGSKIRATEVGQSAADLFENPENGNLTFKNGSSIIYTSGAGDSRWLY